MRLIYDLVIIGGGILGLSHAASASAVRGKSGGGGSASSMLRILVLEKNPAAVGATVRNFGLLTQLYNDNTAWGHRARRSRELYRQWADEGAIQLTITGSLQLLQSEYQYRVAEEYIRKHKEEQMNLSSVIPPTLLSPKEVEDACPAVTSDSIYGALHFANDGLLEPRILTSRFAHFLRTRRQVEFRYNDAAVDIRPASVGATTGGEVSPKEIIIRTAKGESIVASSVIVCSGDDVVSLFPDVFHQEASKLKLCKLQMTHLDLGRKGAASGRYTTHGRYLTMPVTSGLSMRRYPAFQAVCPDMYASMMKNDTEGADPAAEALGIHIIARPAGKLPRGKFGELIEGASSSSSSEAVQLNMKEAIVGDSHQYAAIGMQNSLDDTCDEKITDEILRVTSSMIHGVEELYHQRTGKGSGRRRRSMKSVGSKEGDKGGGFNHDIPHTSFAEYPRILRQWPGVYLQHSDGILNKYITFDPPPIISNSGTTSLRLHSSLAEMNSGSSSSGSGILKAGVIQIVTGIGGKGMTMSPAIAEENIALLMK